MNFDPELLHGRGVDRLGEGARAALPAETPKPANFPRPMWEKEFQRLVIDYAHLRGWRVASFRPARVMRNGREKYETAVGADGKGWPDLFLVRDNRLVALELKVGKNKPSDEQQAWLAALQRVCDFAACVWPADWELIERVLA